MEFEHENDYRRISHDSFDRSAGIRADGTVHTSSAFHDRGNDDADLGTMPGRLQRYLYAVDEMVEGNVRHCLRQGHQEVT